MLNRRGNAAARVERVEGCVIKDEIGRLARPGAKEQLQRLHSTGGVRKRLVGKQTEDGRSCVGGLVARGHHVSVLEVQVGLQVQVGLPTIG